MSVITKEAGAMTCVVHVKKAGESFSFNFAELPEASQNYLIGYGARQAIADACASAKTEAEAKGLCQKRLDNLLKGVIRAERESDPVAREARRIAVEKTNKWAKANGIVLTAKDDATASVKAAVEANVVTWTKRVEALRAHPDVIKRAEANVAALDELDIDIEV